MIRARYCGKSEYYDKVKGRKPILLSHGGIYNIVYDHITPNRYRVVLVDNGGEIITFIPYNCNPFLDYWKVL